MDFTLSDVQRSFRSKAESLGRELGDDGAAADVVMGAARAGLIDARADFLATALAVEALAYQSSATGIAFGLHAGIVLALGPDDRFTSLVRGETVGAIALSTDDMPAEAGGRIAGRASLVGPLTEHGIAIVGTRAADGDGSRQASRSGWGRPEGGRPGPESARHSIPEPPPWMACAVSLDIPDTTIEPMQTAALRGFACGHLVLNDAECIKLGATIPFMTRIRTLLAAAGLGMGRRALAEALLASRGYRGRGAGGEQTVQGLLADAATELDAATMLVWKAASARTLSLADASMAKLAATDATQRAVARATQVVGIDSFRRGHVIEQLAQDVRALELFAGRTEALREAVADEVLPS